MDTLYLHDTITQIKTVFDTINAVDTVFVQAQSAPKAWYETWAPWAGLALTIASWFVGYHFARRNAMRSFEEGVLDKIRIELNGPLMTYQTFLTSLLNAADMLMRADPVDGGESSHGVYVAPTAESILKPLEIPGLAHWMNLFDQYSLCFANFQEAYEVIKRRHTEILRKIRRLENEYTQYNTDGKIHHAQALFSLADNQYRLWEQFFIFLQFECMQNMKRVKEPNFDKMRRGERIIRTQNGRYKVVDPERTDGTLAR